VCADVTAKSQKEVFMRIKANFSVFPRTLSSGRKVFYYQCYDGKGRRLWAKSTGKARLTEAKKYCENLFKEGLLIPEAKVPTFAEFSKGWWDSETCNYLKWRTLHEPLEEGTVHSYRGNFHNHIKDYFAKFKLDEITPKVVEDWLLAMSEKKQMGTRNRDEFISKSSINKALLTFRIMLDEAVKSRFIKSNPCGEVKRLKKDDVDREIFTVEEVKKLFAPNWISLWKNKVVYLMNRLAACTGMRIGEIRGLRCEYVFDDYIFVCGQFTFKGYKKHTKTKHNRNIPITPLMRNELEELLAANGDGFVFSENGGKTPVCVNKMTRRFDKALERIGIDRKEKLRRNLSFHCWRHFLNTLLRMSNVVDSKVQKVTGHRSQRMTEHYTHFDTRQFTEVRDVQAKLLTCNEVVINVTENTEVL